MRSAALLLSLLLPLAVAAAADYMPAGENSGFLLPLPHVLHAGSDDYCQYLFNLQRFAGHVRRLRVRFLSDDRERRPLFSVVKEVDDGKVIDCLGLPVPLNVTNSRVRVEVVLETSDGSVVHTDHHRVTLTEDKPPIYLVTRDKPQYRPGDHAHFQLTMLHRNLRPAGGPGDTHTVPEVWVTNPDGVRVAQWRHTPVTYGVATFNLHIAEQYAPKLPQYSGITENGHLDTWKIHFKAKDFYKAVDFTVGEVASTPVFKVEIKAPKLLTRSQKTITVGACASYLFDKPLVGANISIGFRIEEWSQANTGRPAHAETNSNGCVLLDLILSTASESDSVYSTSFSNERLVVLNVNVTDPASGAVEKREVRIGQKAGSAILTLLQEFAAIAPKLPRTLMYQARFETGDLAVNQTLNFCWDSHYYPPTRTSSTTLTVPSEIARLSDYSALLPHHELEKLSPEVKKQLNAIPLLWRTSSEHEAQMARDCRDVRTDSDGVAKIQFPQPAERIHKIRVSVNLKEPGTYGIGHTQREFNIMTSPSHSYLALDLSKLPPKLPCRGDVKLPLLTTVTGNMPAVQLQVMARGRVMAASVTNSSHPLDLTLHMTPEMSPRLRLVVYSQLESGEVIADSVQLAVDVCFPNEVTVSWDEPNVAPGEDAIVNVAAAPHSQCTVIVKDAGTDLRWRAKNSDTAEEPEEDYELTEKRAVEIIKGLDDFSSAERGDPDLYCKGLQSKLFSILLRAGVRESSLARLLNGFRLELVRKTSTSFGFDTYTDTSAVFRYAGFVPFASAGIHHAPCVKNEHYDHYGRRRRHAMWLSLKSGAPLPYAAGVEQPDVRVDTREEVIYHSTHTVNDQGSAQVSLKLPGQVTSWVASVVCIHPQKGLGIAEKVSAIASKLLFAKMTMPHAGVESIKLGEQLTLPVTVFNNYDSAVSVHVSLDTSDVYLPGSVGPDAYVLCIAPHRSQSVRFSVRFFQIGAVKVSVTLEARTGACHEANTVHPPREVVSKFISIRPQGYVQEDVTSHFVCLDPGASQEVVVDVPTPGGLVNGSAWLYVSVFGDHLEPSALYPGRILRSLDHGFEPAMLEMMHYVYIDEYFLATNLMISSQRRDTESSILQGLRKALKYRREDGSFSSHGNQDDEGSLWLTALTIKTFNDAAKSYPKVAARMGEFDDGANWVMRHQGDDGCFHPVGDLLHQDIMGGVEKVDHVALTAYVILALHDVIDKHRLMNSLGCLEYSVKFADASLYTKILMTYTYLQLGLDAHGGDWVKSILKEATTEGDDVLYWREDMSNSIYGARPVADLEMTSYMTLALIHLSGAENMVTANKAVNWLVRQVGGKPPTSSSQAYENPQAQAIALQALSAFSRRTYSSEAESTISVAIGDRMPLMYHVNAENRLLQQRYRVKNVQLPSRVRFEVTGGCVTLQTSLHYVSHSEIPNPAFSLVAEATERPSKVSGSSYSMSVCVKSSPQFSRVDKARMRIELPSGFIAVRTSLRQLRYNGEIEAFAIDAGSQSSRPALDDVTDDVVHAAGAVSLTLVDITEREAQCVTFRIVRAFEVDNLKPSGITVWDVYHPQKRASLEYNLTGLGKNTTRPSYIGSY